MQPTSRQPAHKNPDLKGTRAQLWQLLAPESSFYGVIIVYGIAISLLTLAVPIAVQTLINSIANLGALRAVYSLALALFLILLSYGALSALRVWMSELYRRRVFTRLSAEISFSVIRAPAWFFEGGRNAGLTHRYFDIMTLQKNVPRLLADGFALVLQMVVGFTLVAFYHPALFLFNVMVILTVLVIWKVWSGGARRHALALSREKYAMARWLNQMEIAHEFFKTGRHVDLAADKTATSTQRYLASHRDLFRFTFSQTLSFLFLYALGSAALLGLGGWLVILGELSIGQLVAAELVMASIFVGLSRFSSYLKDYYELYGAADKLAEVLSIPEEQGDNGMTAPERGPLCFDNVVITRGEYRCRLQECIESGEKVLLRANQAWIQRTVLSVLRAHHQPQSGHITLAGRALQDLDVHELRNGIHAIDRSPILESTIGEYLQLNAPSADTAAIHNALDAVGLGAVVADFPAGIDTPLSQTCAPLQGAEMLLLKLAAALLAQPAILVLNQLFDQVTPEVRDQVFTVLARQDFTVMYFSSLSAEAPFGRYIELLATEVNAPDG